MGCDLLDLVIFVVNCQFWLCYVDVSRMNLQSFCILDRVGVMNKIQVVKMTIALIQSRSVTANSLVNVRISMRIEHHGFVDLEM